MEVKQTILETHISAKTERTNFLDFRIRCKIE